jgi:putative ABC transport system ATP-binding protein
MSRSPEKHLIAIENMRRTYPMGDTDIHALNGVDLTIDRNEYVAIMGPSGSGKTTLMNLIGCLDSPNRGTYWLNGYLVSELGDSQLARIRNSEIGFVFQTFNLLNRASALQNVELPLIYKGLGKKKRLQKARDMLEKVGLGNRAKHTPSEMSGGQRQRVAIARALVTEPSILLADEPTGNLDSHMAMSVMELISEINRNGTTIIMVTHDPALAEMASRNVHILDGRVSDNASDNSSDTQLPHVATG